MNSWGLHIKIVYVELPETFKIINLSSMPKLAIQERQSNTCRPIRNSHGFRFIFNLANQRMREEEVDDACKRPVCLGVL